MQNQGKEKRWPMGTEAVLNTDKSHQKELLGYRLECVTQLEPAYKRSLSKSIRDTRGQLILCPQLAQSDKFFKDKWERKSVLGGSTADMLPCFWAAAAGRWSSCSCSKEPGFPGRVSIRQSKWRRGRHGCPGWEIPLHNIRKLSKEGDV